MRASLTVPEWLDSSRIDPETGDVKIGSDCEEPLATRGTATVVIVAAGRVHASGASIRFVAESKAPANTGCFTFRNHQGKHFAIALVTLTQRTQRTELFKCAPHHRVE